MRGGERGEDQSDYPTKKRERPTRVDVRGLTGQKTLLKKRRGSGDGLATKAQTAEKVLGLTLEISWNKDGTAEDR